MKRSTWYWFSLSLALFLVVSLVVVGCGKSKSTTYTSTPTVAPTSTPTSPSYTVSTSSKTSIGNYLVDANGMTLYYFAKDIFGASNASGTILQTWPVFYSQNIVIPSNLTASDFATITRADGSKQTTYYGWPLYRYAGDQAAGDIKGDGVGGVWFLVKVDFYTVLIMNKSGIGNFLADANGMTLYWTSKDSVGQSNITGTTLANWPVFYSTADSIPTLIIPTTLKSTDFGTITRSDGNKQTTYKGYPLYYYIQDKASGDTNGQGVGGVWFAVDPVASAPAPVATTTPTATPVPPTSTPTSTPITTPSPTQTPTAQNVSVTLTAKGISFDKKTITVPAGAHVTMTFNNQDNGIPHNFALYTDSSAQTQIYIGSIVTGPTTTTYTFDAPAQTGTYFFRCDIHPTTMTGSFIVN
jgi:predicted lipoprotein with Yx(FWY)xxD motif/plastocyanin